MIIFCSFWLGFSPFGRVLEGSDFSSFVHRSKEPFFSQLEASEATISCNTDSGSFAHCTKEPEPFGAMLTEPESSCFVYGHVNLV